MSDKNNNEVQMKQGNCFCCNSLLQYPKNINCFKCLMCNVINDLVPLNKNRPDIILSSEITENLKETGNVQIYAEYIKNYFSNFNNINSSYIGYKEINNIPVINYEDLWKTYNCIENSPPEVIEEMMNGIEHILERPGKKIQNNYDLRFLLIIFENPLLYRNSNEEEKKRNHEILKKLFGLMSCMPSDLHKYIIYIFESLPRDKFKRKVELVNHFISYRLIQFEGMDRDYPDDWAIKSASRVMAFLYKANFDQNNSEPISIFYNMAVDLINIQGDFDNWQSNQPCFSFSQYPFLISLGQKIKIMKIENIKYLKYKFGNNFRCPERYFDIQIRRDHLIEDSLNQIQLALVNQMDMKKQLRISFIGEDGVDAGGITKEWLFLLVRELFDPQYGMFDFDEESGLCWFSPVSLEHDNEYRLVGIIIGLAIYNGIILDIRFPLACYKLILKYCITLEDFKEIRPSVARGFEQLLNYEGDDIEEVMNTNFVAYYEKFGQSFKKVLIENGENILINKSNRYKYVCEYIRWFFIESVEKKFEAFKEGFLLLCSGNLLQKLCRPEEIEMMIIGEAEIDISRLQGIAKYKSCTSETPVVKWFWEIVNNYDEDMRKKLMMFITGTNRTCPTGIENMTLVITYINESKENLPQSHTCFNEIQLFNYESKEILEEKLKKSINYSEGYGMR